MHSSNPKLIVIITNLLEHEFRYETFTTFAVMQSQVSKYLVIKDWLLLIDLRMTALSVHWLLILYPLCFFLY